MRTLRTMGRPRKPSTVSHTFRGIEISLYPRKRGDWEAGFTIPGQDRDKATGPNERECREAAVEKIRKAWDPVVMEARRDEDRAREILQPLGVTLTESARFYVSEHKQPEISATVSELRNRWLIKMKTHSWNHYRSCRQRTTHILTKFGGRQISSLTLAEMNNYQDELELEVETKRTLRNIHDANQSMFIFGRKRGYLAEDRLTVAERMDRPIAEAGKKGIFSTEEGQSLLDTGWGYAMPGSESMAVIMFGSTRSEENSKQDPDAPMERRICWEDLGFVEKLIGIRPEVAKTRVGRDAGFPPNLRKMLRPLRGTGPLYTGKRLDLAFAAIARRAGVPWKFNGLRHSCITYDMLLAPNATEVANRSGNSVEVIERCYRNIKAKRKDAVGWFKLRPRVAWGAYLRPDQAKPMQA